MTEDPVQSFADQLISEVNENVSEETPFSQEVFTQLILERLEDAGHLEGTFPLYQEGRIGNANYRVDGYAYDEERSRLELFTTIYSDEMPPPKLHAADVGKAIERVLRF